MFIGYLACSCRPQDEDTIVAIVKEAMVDFPSKASERVIDVETNLEDWRAESPVNWCKVSNSNNTIRIWVDENKDSEIREVFVKIFFRQITKEVRIRQLGKGLQVLVNKKRIPVDAKGGNIDFTVTSNTNVSLQYPDWIRPSQARALMKDHKYSLHVDKNNTGATRTGKILIFQKDNQANESLKKSIIVEQKFDGKYENTTEGIVDDIKIKVISGSADQAQNGDGIEKSYDGDYNTIYHSPYYGNTKMPVTLTYNFAKVEDLDYIIYHPRKSGNNGNFKLVDIYYSHDGNNFIKLLSKDFAGSSSATKVVLDRRIKAKSVRFIVKSGSGYGNTQFAACSEMEFYKNNPNKFDYKTLFTDELCSELKRGISLQDINKCQQPFYKNIALHLYNGSYQKEFRIADFKLYLNPSQQVRYNKTNPYSKRDNPTGIEVKQNEELILFVGKMHGISNVKLCVQNLDKPNGDGFGGKEYSLIEGLNRIKIQEKGLIYVIYMTDDWNKLDRTPKLKLHFVTGTVNGYYDSQNPKHIGRAKELLASAKGQYFDLVGKYAHLTFPTDKFRSATKDMHNLIETYDKLVKSEMELLGLFKYNKVFKNRMYFNVMYTSFMYATGFHTAYNNNTSDAILNDQHISNKSGYNFWGPAHEVGHMNQTKPAVCWRGLTEVTNNIMSEYITTTIFHQPSRIYVEDITWGNNRYTKAFNGIIVPRLPFAYAASIRHNGKFPAEMPEHYQKVTPDDVFCKLVPFWQLQLYFGNVLGRTPDKQSDKGGFYPDVYEWGRTHTAQGSISGDNNHHGLNQTEFVYIASKASGYDLTDFFEKWGFLSPVNTMVDDYAYQPIVIDQTRINEIKQRVKGLGLPKLNIPLEYITDGNTELFKNPQEVIQGSKARWSGIDIMVDGWKNVVVYEVWDKPYGTAGAKLVYAGDGYDAKGSPSTAKLAVVRNYIGKDTTAYLYAVDIHNRRISIPL